MAILLIIILIVGERILWGNAVNAVLKKKGYNDDWFLWGLIFGFVTFVVAWIKVDLNNLPDDIYFK